MPLPRPAHLTLLVLDSLLVAFAVLLALAEAVMHMLGSVAYVGIAIAAVAPLLAVCGLLTARRPLLLAGWIANVLFAGLAVWIVGSKFYTYWDGIHSIGLMDVAMVVVAGIRGRTWWCCGGRRGTWRRVRRALRAREAALRAGEEDRRGAFAFARGRG